MKMSPHSRRVRRLRRPEALKFLGHVEALLQKGFTLVEVTLAIGVVSFAMIALLGLLPVGLTNFQEASTISVRAQIAQALVGEVSRTDYANIVDKVYYFDNEGIQLPSAAGHVYEARVQEAPLEAADIDSSAGKRVLITVENIRTRNTGGPGAKAMYPVIVPKVGASA